MCVCAYMYIYIYIDIYRHICISIYDSPRACAQHCFPFGGSITMSIYRSISTYLHLSIYLSIHIYI